MTQIRTKARKETVEDLIRRDNEEGYDEPKIGVIAEMIVDARKLRDFGFNEAQQARGVKLAEDAGDDAPEFAVVRTESGASRSGRFYGADVIESIAEQVNLKQPVAYLGHIKDDDLATALPEPQTTWFAATTTTEQSTSPENKGKRVKVMYTAGYLLPGAKIKTFLKTKAVNSTSWQGYGVETKIPNGGVEVSDFKLESLDWARKGSEGMQTARVVALAREMHEGGKTQMGDKNEGKSLAEVTPEEFKDENPNGYRVLVQEISAEKDKEIEVLSAESEDLKKEKTLLDEIRGVLKITADDDVLGQIASLVKKLGERAKVSVEEALDKVLAEKVPDEGKRAVVKRLALVGEMTAKAEKLPEDADVEAVESIVREMVEEQFNSDDVVKGIISEQTPSLLRRTEQLRDQVGSVDYSKLGMEEEVVSL